MLYLWEDELYKNSYSWYERYSNLKQVLRTKRMELLEINSLEMIPPADPQPVVLIRSASKHFVTSAVIAANERGVYPILIANIPPNTGLHCSVIGSNMREDTLRAIDYLESLGCRSIAFFGVNPAPFSDNYRAEIFQTRKRREDIYYADISFDEAIKRFLLRVDEYDGIIVTNSATAIALVTTLLEKGYSEEDLPNIVSFGRLRMSDYYSPGITSINDDISALGETVLSLYKMVQRCGNALEVSVYLPSVITPRKTTGYTVPHDENRFARYTHPYEENRYYDSFIISEVMCVEKMIQQSDEIDKEIIRGLICGKTYDIMAEQLFLNRNAIDYRVQKLKKIAQKNNVSELKKMLSRFLRSSSL